MSTSTGTTEIHYSQLRPGDLIKRDTLGTKFLEHYGIYYGYMRGVHWVFENSKNGHPTLVPYDRFALGRKVTFQRIPGEERRAAIARANWALENPTKWDALSYNCEHAARFVAEGKVYSEQLRGYAVVAALVLFMVFGK